MLLPSRRSQLCPPLIVALLLILGTQATAKLAVYPEQGKLQVKSTAVLLHPQKPKLSQLGQFVFRGGLHLSTADSDQLHGLSDLEVTAQNQLWAVGDRGALFKTQLVLGPDSSLKGVEKSLLTPLLDESGQPFLFKEAADAEGMARMPGGDMLVSFEEQHRILKYPANGEKPWPVPFPRQDFEANQAMEALALDRQNPRAYWVGSEFSGEVWHCVLDLPECQRQFQWKLPPDFYLVALRHLPKNRFAYLLRAYFPESGINKILLRIVSQNQPNKIEDQLELAPPLSVDNFEGLAAVPLANGGVRFYLLSDDNFNPHQRTLLLAFDWKPAKP